MKWLKIFAISFSMVFIFALFGVLSFSSLDRSNVRFVNFDKGVTIVVPVYEVTMDPILVSGTIKNNAQCQNSWDEPAENKCCV